MRRESRCGPTERDGIGARAEFDCASDVAVFGDRTSAGTAASGGDGAIRHHHPLKRTLSGGDGQASSELLACYERWRVAGRRAGAAGVCDLPAQRGANYGAEPLAPRDGGQRRGIAVYRIWEDSAVELLLTKSAATVKADAAQRAFSAMGEGIVWAVIDSGIDGSHPHFRAMSRASGGRTLDLPRRCGISTTTAAPGDALKDPTGHGRTWRASSRAHAGG